MKILHLRASNFYGGPERQLHYHARLARGTEFEIVLGSFSEKGSAPELLNIAEKEGLAVKLFEVKNAYDRRAPGMIRDYLTIEKIDLLCTHDYRSHILGYRGVKKTGARWVAFSRGWTKDTLKVRIFTLVEKIVIRFADHIVAVSNAQKDKLTALSIPTEEITVAHNAIDIESLKNVVTVDLKKRFNFPEEAVVIVAGGRFSREKGQVYLIKAAEQTLKKNDRLRFLLFGDGPDWTKVKNIIVQEHLEDKIICPGFEKNLLGCIKAADILVNPSLSEGLPNIVLESMALEVPVIATAVGGVPELIKDGFNGLLVPKADARSLSEAIIKLARDRELRRKYAGAASGTLAGTFSFERQLVILGEMYRQMAGDGPRGSGK
ncbi:putative Glycosyl transferase group 1 [Candidatus Zixiibacteriota bacterium]|nr:putative Glycosyl transferase group 1 [candidate division Zixibacteria bacterium]